MSADVGPGLELVLLVTLLGIVENRRIHKYVAERQLDRWAHVLDMTIMRVRSLLEGRTRETNYSG